MFVSLRSSVLVLLSFLAALPSPDGALGAVYDPLRVDQREPAPERVELRLEDAGRGRSLPLLAYLPATRGAAPVVLFSHGLGGSRSNNPYLGEHWARRGYVALFLQHPGSDESVWRDAPRARRVTELRGAADAESFRERIGDVDALLDELPRWNARAGHALAGRLDLERIGMSGHSFGAVTTQAVAGQRFPFGRSFTDPRLRAAVLMSPSPPRERRRGRENHPATAVGGSPSDAFGGVSIPWLLLTGSADGSPIGGLTPADRLAVYPALPPGGKYELVLDGAEHSAFGDRALPGDREARNPNHHRAILALTTAFWDAYLRNDAAARAWLDGAGPRGVLDPADRWQRK